MPELPEVETTLRGIEPFVLNHKIVSATLRHTQLRWPIPKKLAHLLTGQTVLTAARRGKYLLLGTETGTLIIHLGMSGRIRMVKINTPYEKHDHVDIVFHNHYVLRFTDPRRFGAVLWTTEDPSEHVLLKTLGPEPLTAAFSGKYLWQQAAKRKTPIKSFIMDSRVVVGVGNIYANEALFAAGIHPEQHAGSISQATYQALAQAIKSILRAAIKQGGTTIKDFVGSDGKRGYFSVLLHVYGRGGQPCTHCKTPLTEIRLTQRTTVFCSRCQSL